MLRVICAIVVVVAGFGVLDLGAVQAQEGAAVVLPGDGLPTITIEEMDTALASRASALGARSLDLDVVGGPATDALNGGSGIGWLCNASYNDAVVTWNRRGYDETLVGTLTAGYCNDIEASDVDGVWGRTCTLASCWHQVFKVGDGIVFLYDGGRNPLPPYRWVNVNALSWSYKDPVGMYDLAWARERGWAIPSLYAISYRLYR